MCRVGVFWEVGVCHEKILMEPVKGAKLFVKIRSAEGAYTGGSQWIPGRGGNPSYICTIY